VTSPLGERNHPVVIAVAVLACHAVCNDPLLTDDVSGKRETLVRVHVLLKETPDYHHLVDGPGGKFTGGPAQVALVEKIKADISSIHVSVYFLRP